MNRAIAWGLALLVAFALSAVQCTSFSPANQAPTRQDGSLTMTFPLGTTELVGGQSLRVTASLVDHNDRPVEGATVQTEPVSFRGWPAWYVTGHWESTPSNGNPSPGGLVEWMVFPCPGSDWLWTVVIATNDEESYMDDLRTLRGTFECPTSRVEARP